MRQWTVGSGDKDRRLSRYLQKKLPGAPSSFLYKMLRKKNITLNGKKASGNELLYEGDLVTFFLSDETIKGFGGAVGNEETSGEGAERKLQEYVRAYRQLRGRIGPDGILYEDDNILAARKPVGVLSQKAEDTDISMNEWFVGYLLEKGETGAGLSDGFRPSVCNRLDRNTGGILLFAKTLRGARKMAELLRDRSLKKYYQAAVAGTVKESGSIGGYLVKDRMTNRVTFQKAPVPNTAPMPDKDPQSGAGLTRTTYRPLITGRKYSLLELELITGKTHQIRSHLASIGHPVLGDPKYGDLALNKRIRDEYGLRGQMLWCSRVEFPQMDGEFADLSKKVILCDPPALYRSVCERQG